MERSQVNQLLAIHGNKLPFESIEMVKTKLLTMEYDIASIRMAQFKDPMTSLILSILVGSLGADRFYLGDIGLGVGKLLTCGGCYIWWLIDLFTAGSRTRQYNANKILEQI